MEAQTRTHVKRKQIPAKGPSLARASLGYQPVEMLEDLEARAKTRAVGYSDWIFLSRFFGGIDHLLLEKDPDVGVKAFLKRWESHTGVLWGYAKFRRADGLSRGPFRPQAENCAGCFAMELPENWHVATFSMPR